VHLKRYLPDEPVARSTNRPGIDESLPLHIGKEIRLLAKG